jgi:hypothetical protein
MPTADLIRRAAAVGGGLKIKRVMSGSETGVASATNHDVTLPESVNVEKSILLFTTRWSSGATTPARAFWRGMFLNPNTVRFTRNSSSSTWFFEWTVVEFDGPVLVQYVGTQSAAVSALGILEYPLGDISKSFLIPAGSETSWTGTASGFSDLLGQVVAASIYDNASVEFRRTNANGDMWTGAFVVTSGPVLTPVYLYKEGVEHVNWDNSLISDPTRVTATKNADHLNILTTSTVAEGAWSTDLPVDVGPYSAAVVDWELISYGSGTSWTTFMAAPTKEGTDAQVGTFMFQDIAAAWGRRQDVVSLEDLTGEMFIRTHLRKGTGTSNKELKVYGVRLVPNG